MAFGKENANKIPNTANMLLDEFKIYPYPTSGDQIKAVYQEYSIYGTGP